MTNIAEILKNAPKGLKLYSPLFGEVEFIEVSKNNMIYIEHPGSELFYEDGRFYEITNSECLLFPSKEHRTWDDWQNVLFPKSIGCVVYTTLTNSAYLLTENGTVFSNNTGSMYDTFIKEDGNYLPDSHYATPEETEQFFGELKANGYKWDGKSVIKINSDKLKAGNVLRHGGLLALCLGGRKAVKCNNEQLTIQYPDEWVVADEGERDCFFRALLDNGYYYAHEENVVKKFISDETIDSVVQAYKDSLPFTGDYSSYGEALTHAFKQGVVAGIKLTNK